MKKFVKLSIIKFLVILIVIVLDLVTKHFFYKTNYNIIPYIIGFREMSSLNTGGAWGILGSSTWLLIAITIIAVVCFCIFDLWIKKTNIFYSLSISFLLGGAIGNLIDRIALGGVRDFIYFQFMPNFPTFNLADTFIFIGAFLLFIFILFLNKEEKNKQGGTKLKN